MDRGERALSDAERSEVVASDFDPGAVFGPFESAPRKPRRDDVVECTATALDGRGRTVGRVGSYRLVLEGALPGDRVRAVVSRRRGERVEARASSILVPSRDRVEPRCAHVHDCGGCRFQELAYARQLAELASAADERLAPLVRFGLVLDEIVGAEDPWRYRNKMDLTFASRRWVERDDDGRRTDFALGMHARGRHDKVVDVGACWLQGDVGDRVVASARARALELGVPPWDLVAHEGFLRHLVVRRGVRTGEWLVYVVTSTDEEPRFERWWRGLLDDVPEITTLVHGATARLSSVAIGDVDTVLHGAGTIRERLGGIEFTISPRSFFQTNTAQAERLVDIVRSFAGTGGVLWDSHAARGCSVSRWRARSSVSSVSSRWGRRARCERERRSQRIRTRRSSRATRWSCWRARGRGRELAGA
ncbi:MAG: hypothetical protein R3F34_20085 [Planctomycetota bacterium]